MNTWKSLAWLVGPAAAAALSVLLVMTFGSGIWIVALGLAVIGGLAALCYYAGLRLTWVIGAAHTLRVRLRALNANQILTLAFCGLLGAVVLHGVLTLRLKDPVAFSVRIVLLIGLGGTVTLLSFRQIGSTDRLVAKLLGNPWGVYVNPSDLEGLAKGARPGLWGTGVVFLLWPFFSVQRAPTRQLRLNFEADQVLTGAERGERRSKRKRKGRKKAEPLVDTVEEAELKVDTEVYLSWGTGENLLTTIRHLDADPGNIEQLQAFYRPAVVDAVRKIAGGRTWRVVIKDRQEFESAVVEELRDPESPFVRTGLLPARGSTEEPGHHIDLAITRVEFVDEELKKQYSAPQAARFALEKKKREAEGAAYEAEAVGAARAKALDLEYEVRQSRDPQGVYSAAEAWKNAQGSTNIGIITDEARGVLAGLAGALGTGMGIAQKQKGTPGGGSSKGGGTTPGT